MIVPFVLAFSAANSSAQDQGYDPEARLAELGITLRKASSPVANYVNAVRTGDLLYLSGKGPLRPDGTMVIGKVGADLSVEEGYEAARLVGIQLISTMKDELGDLSRVRRVVKALGMVNAAPDFGAHPAVINGFLGSDGGSLRRQGPPCPIRHRHGLAAGQYCRGDRGDCGGGVGAA